MDFSLAHEACINKIDLLVKIGLCPPPNRDEVEELVAFWERGVRAGHKTPMDDFTILFQMSLIYNDIEYNDQFGPDSKSIEAAINSFSKISRAAFSLSDVSCSIKDNKYFIQFTWRGSMFGFSVYADPDYKPLEEIAKELNKILVQFSAGMQFLSITPPLPAEDAGYIFATVESVRKGVEHGLIWSNV
jgi:hypothetical protein